LVQIPAPDDISHLLAALYAGLLEDQPWDGFLNALSGYLGASYATLILTAPGQSAPDMMRTPGADPKANEDYLAEFFATDPFQGLPEGEVVSFREFMEGSKDPALAAYRGFLANIGGDQVLGVDLRFPSGFEARCRVTRDQSLVDFSPAERARFQAIVPHLRTAGALFERLHLAGAEHGVYRSAVEQLGVGTIILDGRGQIVRANAVAERLIAAKDGVSQSEGRLVLPAGTPADTIAALLAKAGGTGRFKITRASGGDLAVVARPITLPAMMRGGAALALFLSLPGADAQLDPDAIRDLFQLTRMEANLAVALASGGSLVEAADRLGIAHNTARAHLRAIFAKTGVRRQSQLVHLLRSGLA
jgi:DNA-binding CsgD family transcriptional regulator/PAS domain-containing protein